MSGVGPDREQLIEAVWRLAFGMTRPQCGRVVDAVLAALPAEPEQDRWKDRALDFSRASYANAQALLQLHDALVTSDKHPELTEASRRALVLDPDQGVEGLLQRIAELRKLAEPVRATDPVRAAAEDATQAFFARPRLFGQSAGTTGQNPVYAALEPAMQSLRAALAADREPAGEPCWESFWKERYDEQHRKVRALEDEIARLKRELEETRDWGNSSEHPNWEAGWKAGYSRGRREPESVQITNAEWEALSGAAHFARIHNLYGGMAASQRALESAEKKCDALAAALSEGEKP